MSTTLLAAAACVLGLLGLATAVLALRTLAKLRSSVRVLNRALGRDSLVEVQAHHLQLASDAARGVTELRAHVDRELASMQTGFGAAVDAVRTDHRAELTEQAARTTARDADDQGAGGAALEAARTDLDNARTELDNARTNLTTTRTELATDVRAAHGELTQARNSLLEEVATQRANLASDQNAAQDMVRAALDEVGNVVNASLRRVALVRFDAFDDLSGRLSFCLALLDGHGDGIALTSLASQRDTRLYARPIKAGSSEIELIPEEKQAVRAALAV